jgi:NADH-quinone oxidoreductase subunit F
MLDVLDGMTKGQGKIEDMDMLYQLAHDRKAGSLCKLGKTAPNPILTTLRYFRDEYEAHITQGRCPALMCRELIACYIITQECPHMCVACMGSCTMEAITVNMQRDLHYEQGWRELKVIDQEKCVKCGSCFDACPLNGIAAVKLSPPNAMPETR